MKIVIKQSDLKQRNPMAIALHNPLFRNRIIMSKKAYNRKKKDSF
jgi:stalled ribosome alternative rescue factor ArfA